MLESRLNKLCGFPRRQFTQFQYFPAVTTLGDSCATTMIAAIPALAYPRPPSGRFRPDFQSLSPPCVNAKSTKSLGTLLNAFPPDSANCHVMLIPPRNSVGRSPLKYAIVAWSLRYRKYTPRGASSESQRRELLGFISHISGER